MSQNNTLRIGRCARRVGDGCVVIVLDCATDFEELLAVFSQVLLALSLQHRESDLALLQILNFVHYDHLLQFGQTLADTTNFGQLVFRNKDRLNIGVL